jgi:hypothetical protein
MISASRGRREAADALEDPLELVAPLTRSSVVWIALRTVVSSMLVCGLRDRSRKWFAARLCAMRMSQGRSGRPVDSRWARSKCR